MNITNMENVINEKFLSKSMIVFYESYKCYIETGRQLFFLKKKKAGFFWRRLRETTSFILKKEFLSTASTNLQVL